MSFLSGIKAIVFDLDGTIYFGDQLADGVLDLLKILSDKKIEVFYFTNNSSKSRKQIHQKLLNLKINVELERVYNSAYAAATYAKKNNLKKIFCLGTKDLEEQFLEFSIEISDSKVDAVFIGTDPDFNYKKLAQALNVANDNDCALIACNIDKNFPIENNQIMPGCGSIVAALETALNRKVDFVIGKPNKYMMDLLVSDWGVRADQMMVIGDSIESDIAIAKNFGCKSILISDQKFPDIFSVKSIIELKDLLQK